MEIVDLGSKSIGNRSRSIGIDRKSIENRSESIGIDRKSIEIDRNRSKSIEIDRKSIGFQKSAFYKLNKPIRGSNCKLNKNRSFSLF